MSLMDLSLKDVHKRLKAGELTAVDLVTASLERIKEVDNDIQAFLLVDEERAIKKAQQLDANSDKASTRPLTAVPAGIKDNISTEGIPTTCASRMLENYKPIYNATVMDKLSEAQVISVGKVNMDEFAMGSTTENSGFKKTYNPWDLERVPGGSSGGSAAAVAAGEVFFSLGSDTGGSIRQPAAFCGVVGLKPTYGLVSRYGLVAFASTMDQIGPLTRSVEDAAIVLQAIAGHDPHDSTSAQVDIPDYTAALTGEVKGLKIGVPQQMLGEGIDDGVKKQVLAALRQLESMGASWEEVTFDHLDYAAPTYTVIASAEASSNLARYDGIRFGARANGVDNLLDLYKQSRSEGFGVEVKRRLLFGTYVISSNQYDAYFRKAQQVRTLIKQDFERMFERYDVIVGPTTPTTAFKVDEKLEDPLTAYLQDYCTAPANLAGLPAISVPCGFTDGLPVGLQIIGKPFAEETVLRVAHAYEQQTDHHLQRPALAKGGQQ